eukprot:2183874-Rhodomonas_salina.1
MEGDVWAGLAQSSDGLSSLFKPARPSKHSHKVRSRPPLFSTSLTAPTASSLLHTSLPTSVANCLADMSAHRPGAESSASPRQVHPHSFVPKCLALLAPPCQLLAY